MTRNLRTIKETPAAQRRLGQLIDMYAGRSEQMVREFIDGREKAKVRIKDHNYIGFIDFEVVDGIRHEYECVIVYVGNESVRICYVVEPDRVVIFWYWRSDDPMHDPRLKKALGIARH